MISNGSQLEAANIGVERIKHNSSLADISRVKRPGKYSRKSEHAYIDDKRKESCITCSSKTCRSGDKCPGIKVECFECGKKGHYRGAQICKKKRTKAARRVQSDEEVHFSDTLSECGKSDESSEDEISKSRRTRSERHITKVKRMRVFRRVHSPLTKHIYEVEVIIKEHKVKVFADTGADVCIMSKKQANKLGLPLSKTGMSIYPFASENMKCCGYHVGTVMYGDNVANIGIYVLNKNVNISGRVAEELGILTLTVLSNKAAPIRNVTNRSDAMKADIVSKYPGIFHGVGRLHDHEVKFHIDETVTPVYEPRRPFPYHFKGNLGRHSLIWKTKA